MTFIDIHAHLDMCKGDLKKIVAKSKENGIGVIVNSGVNKERNRKTLKISEEFPETVRVALGIYPIEACQYSKKEFDSEVDFIRKNKNKIIAIGEIGMDLKESTEREKQAERFGELIKLAEEIDKPVIVHSRKAERECIEVLEKAKAKKVIMHCFSGKLGLVDLIIKNGWYLSIPTSVKHTEHFQNVIRKTPISQLFCETDSPFLHPDKERNNIPANVVESYKKIAEIKGIPLKEVEMKIEENFVRLFGDKAII